MKRTTDIFSIFGQIESVVANAMAEEGLITKINREDIPASARFNEQGEVAHCAVVLTPEMQRAFDERVKRLRA